MMDSSIWALVSLILFILLLVFLKVPRYLGQLLDSRAQRIKEDLLEAERLRTEAVALLEKYEQKRADALKEAEEIVAYAQQESQRILSEAEQQMTDYLAQGERSVAQRLTAAVGEVKQELKEEIVSLSAKVAEVVMAEELEGDSQEKLIHSSLADLKKIIKH